MESVVHHRGRRYKRLSTKKSEPNDSAKSTNDPPHHGFTVLPPPTPPTGKTRLQMTASQSFQYQKFKPLPSIGRGVSDPASVPVVDTDSAVDLTSPTPSSQQTHLSNRDFRFGITQLTTYSQLHSDVERDGAVGKKSTDVTKFLPSTSRNSNSLSTESNTRRGKISQLSKIQLPDFSLPPEPSPNDAHTVTLCIRLPDGARVQRRFNFCVDTLQTVATFAHLNLYQSSLDHQDDFCDFILCDNSVPRVVYDNLSLRLEEVGLVHNTVLQFINQ